MFKLRPVGYKAVNRRQHELISVDIVLPGFVIHPSTSVLAEMLTIDPQALYILQYHAHAPQAVHPIRMA